MYRIIINNNFYMKANAKNIAQHKAEVSCRIYLSVPTCLE